MASFMDVPNKAPLSSDLTLETSSDPSTVVAIDEATDVPNDNRKYSRLVEAITEDFNRSRTNRSTDEQRWLECYRNYRGLYGPSTQFTSSEKSRVFVKITKTKVQAAFAQIIDVLFAGNKFPISVQPQNLPVAMEESINFDPQAPQTAPQPKPQASSQVAPHIQQAMLKLGPKKDILEPVKDKLKAGVGVMPNAITFEPAKDAAKKMEKVIHDQLDEANASKSLRSTVFEMCLFGTGAYKGPFAVDKEYPKWTETGEYQPEIRTIPSVEYVSIWDVFPDPDARNMAEAEKFIQRHRLSKSDLRALKRRPHFRGKNIEKLIEEGPNYNTEYWETALDEDSDQTVRERWEVLEYWGVIDAECAKEAGLKIPKELRGLDQVQVNCWISGSYVLRIVFNPFTPARIPYNIVPYEINPYSFFGIGVAENMLDTQLLMNGFMRMAVDNAALSGNVVMEVNEDLLAPGQSMELYPGKIFRRIGGQPGTALNSVRVDNTSQENLALFDKARQLADESTGMPSYAHGQTGVSGMSRTAAGMSMLMGAAAQNIKAVVRNIDDYLLAPLGKALFAFNMQFNFDKDYIGDVAVVAKGTESLMRNEVRSQRLLQLAEFAAPNPAMAPFIKWDYILREYAASLDLDEDKVVNDPRMAAVQAAQMQAVSAIMQPPGQEGGGGPPEAQGARGGAPAPSDPTQNGNGNIGPGAAPGPSEEGFSGPPA